MTHPEKAKALFEQGYNCAQAVLGAFEDEIGLSRDEIMRLGSSFGGGIGGMRSVCGTVSGMMMAAGLLYGYSAPDDRPAKIAHYARVRELADKFKEEHGSIICRELLGLGEHPQPKDPEERTPAYYKKRPCADMAADAARILDEYIETHPTEKIKSEE
jgi:C_GCAxxG_C_C family probable redox protein